MIPGWEGSEDSIVMLCVFSSTSEIIDVITIKILLVCYERI